MQSHCCLAALQIIVVVLSNFVILCFDHQLQLLWHQSLQLESYRLNEASALVTSVSRQDDVTAGTVFVCANFPDSDRQAKCGNIVHVYSTLGKKIFYFFAVVKQDRSVLQMIVSSLYLLLSLQLGSCFGQETLTYANLNFS